MAAKHSMPHIGITTNIEGYATLKEGVFIDLFLELQDVLNFTYTAYEPADKQWGTLKADGTWTGVVGELDTKKADIALSGLMVTQSRSQAITFSVKMDEVYNAIFINNPSAGFQPWAYLDPLTPNSWISIIVWILVTSPILFITARY